MLYDDSLSCDPSSVHLQFWKKKQLVVINLSSLLFWKVAVYISPFNIMGAGSPSFLLKARKSHISRLYWLRVPSRAANVFPSRRGRRCRCISWPWGKRLEVREARLVIGTPTRIGVVMTAACRSVSPCFFVFFLLKVTIINIWFLPYATSSYTHTHTLSPVWLILLTLSLPHDWYK